MNNRMDNSMKYEKSQFGYLANCMRILCDNGILDPNLIFIVANFEEGGYPVALVHRNLRKFFPDFESGNLEKSKEMYEKFSDYDLDWMMNQKDLYPKNITDDKASKLGSLVTVFVNKFYDSNPGAMDSDDDLIGVHICGDFLDTDINDIKVGNMDGITCLYTGTPKNVLVLIGPASKFRKMTDTDHNRG